jgi:hypothetical protein
MKLINILLYANTIFTHPGDRIKIITVKDEKSVKNL